MPVSRFAISENFMRRPQGSYSPIAEANQNKAVPKEQTGASQRNGPGRQTPAIPNTRPESDSNPPQRYILSRRGS
jgi:hypothetical protein